MMNEVQRWYVGDAGIVAGAALGRLSVVLAADFDRVTAERDALQGRLTVQDQRNDELSAHNQLVRKLLGQAKANLKPGGRLAKAIEAALNPTAEAVSHE